LEFEKYKVENNLFETEKFWVKEKIKEEFKIVDEENWDEKMIWEDIENENKSMKMREERIGKLKIVKKKKTTKILMIQRYLMLLKNLKYY
jgi:hypothetical protein